MVVNKSFLSFNNFQSQNDFDHYKHELIYIYYTLFIVRGKQKDLINLKIMRRNRLW